MMNPSSLHSIGRKMPKLSLLLAISILPLAGLSEVAMESPDPLSTPPEFPVDSESEILEDVYKSYWSILHEPMPPAEEPEMSLPWEPQAAVIISLPLEDMVQDDNYLRLYRQFLSIVLPRQKVLALYHRKDRRLLPGFQRFLQSYEVISANMDQLKFISAEANAMWVRDFGPIFGSDGEGNLLLIDPIYQNPRLSVSNALIGAANGNRTDTEDTLESAILRMEWDRGADITPAILSSYLRVSEEVPTNISRPPLLLQGGDLVLTDKKTAMVTQSSLEANGGSTQAFEDKLKRYMGIDKVHYLNPLPGETIEHLDFIIQVLGPDTILVAMPPVFESHGNAYRQMIKRDLESVLNHNRSIIEREFPDHRIIEIPMPAPLFNEASITVSTLLQRLILKLGFGLGIARGEVADLSDADYSNWKINDKILDRIFLDTNVLSLRTEEDVLKVLSHYSDRPIDELLQSPSDLYTVYRTYLNSLQVVTESGEEFILIPRYRADSEDEEGSVKKMETAVLEAYRQARPNAELLWIDCSDLIWNFGAVHCFAITVPEYPER